MINYFTDNDLLDARKQKKKTLAVFLIALFIYLAVCVVLFVWYRRLPYASKTITTVKAILYSASAIYVIFASIYGGIKLRLAVKYYKLTVNLKTGLREIAVATFLRFDETVTVKDGVDMKALIFNSFNVYKKEYFERKVLVFEDKPFPDIKKGQVVKFVTQGNVLTKYEIINTEKVMGEAKCEQ